MTSICYTRIHTVIIQDHWHLYISNKFVVFRKEGHHTALPFRIEQLVSCTIEYNEKLRFAFKHSPLCMGPNWMHDNHMDWEIDRKGVVCGSWFTQISHPNHTILKHLTLGPQNFTVTIFTRVQSNGNVVRLVSNCDVCQVLGTEVCGNF